MAELIKKPSIISTAITVVFWATLLIGTIWFVKTSLSLNEQKPESPELENFGGNDWVRWDDTPDGIKANLVHPVIKGNPLHRENYVYQGDILKEIDYRPVYKAAMVKDIVYSSPPGKVFIYQIERKKNEFSLETINIFVVNSFFTPFSPVKNLFSWYAGIWLWGIGALLAVIALMILMPVFRTNFKPAIPLLTIIIAFLCLSLTQLIHMLLLIGKENLQDLSLEKVAVFGFIFFSLIYSLGYLWISGTHLRKVNLLLGIITALGPILLFTLSVRDEQTGLFMNAIYSYTLFLISHFFLAAIAFLIHQNSNKFKRQHWLFYIGGLMLFGGLTIWGMVDLFLEKPAYERSETKLLVLQGSLFIPFITAAANQMKFGRVSLVLTQTIVYILLLAITLSFYFLLHAVLIQAGVSPAYRPFVEILIMLIAGIAIRSVYLSNQDFLKKYFISVQQKKNVQMNDFISRIPRITSTKKLSADLIHEVSEFFGSKKACFWLHGDPIPEDFPKDTLPEEIYITLTASDSFWSRNKELSTTSFDEETERKLLDAGFALILPVKVSQKNYGLLLLGRKKGSVFNFSDIGMLQRMIQQIQLSLEVLSLLEKEKVLMEKTYEANLIALRSQINPHFLFNTLNTISALVHDSPDLAEDAIEKLAFIFRYTLKHSSENFVTVKNEMELVHTYLDIEKIRFGEKLEILSKKSSDCDEIQIPAFVIQTVIENCIKHGVSKIVEKGIISIDIHCDRKFLYCIIEDNGPGIQNQRILKGTGLKNITTRLEEIYQIADPIEFINTGKGTKVIIKIPKTHEQNESSHS